MAVWVALPFVTVPSRLIRCSMSRSFGGRVARHPTFWGEPVHRSHGYAWLAPLGCPGDADRPALLGMRRTSTSRFAL